MSSGNPYFSFRNVGDLKKVYPAYPHSSGNQIGKEYDEPTYLTFNLSFKADPIDNRTDITDFDRIPQPLFSTYDKDLDERNYYSSIQYLKDMDENIRYQMLSEFINKWNYLQDNFQWYFQSIDGIADMIKVNPMRGRRVGQDARISIKALEGLDQRISHLLNLYRKVAWDDTYQRWILPDIMRYFHLTIYVTEFRTFHRSQYTQALVNNELARDEYGRSVDDYNLQLSQYTQNVNTPGGLNTLRLFGEDSPPSNPLSPIVSPIKGYSLFLQKLGNVTPTYVLELERCEFDIESIEVLPASLDVGNPEMREVNFDIKVGNLKERYINPPLNTFLYDTIINGFGRTAQGDETIFIGSSNQKSVILGDESYAKVDYRAQVNHQSARPFNISETASSLKNSIPAWANSSYKSFDEVNPTDPATWAGNALTLGKAFVENIVEGAIDKASVVKIPGLGISFNEALTAIQSKNVLSLFGAARRAFGQGVEGTLPSQQLDENFVDTQFKEFLESLVLSEATDEETIELQETANIILSDKGVWEKIKDLSKATDLLSAELNEINIENKITNSNSLRTSYNQEYVPQPLQDGLIYEGIPSSVSTQNDLSSETGIIPQPQSGIASESELSKESGIIPQPLPGEATDNDMDLKEGTTTGLGSTDGNINTDLTTPSPSSSLGNNAGSALDQPSDGLGQSAKGGLATANPGENLGSKAESGGLETSVPGQNLGSDAGNPLPQPGDGLGEFANGRLETIAPSKDLGSAISDNLGTVKPSENLGSNAGTKLPQPGEGLGEVIEGSKIDIPKPGEATDGDPIIGKGPTTSDIKSEATNDKNIKG